MAANPFLCQPPCHRQFKSAAALAQHRANAPRHAPGGTATTGTTANVGVNVSDAANGVHGASSSANRVNGHTSEAHGPQGASIVDAPGKVNDAGSSLKPKKAKGKGKTVDDGETGSKQDRGKGTGEEDDKEKEKEKGKDNDSATINKGNRKDKGKGKENGHRCMPCQKLFATQQALADHVRNSPKHAVDTAAAAPAPGVASSSAPAPSLPAENSKRSKKRKPKTQDKQAQQGEVHVDTPLDDFFRSFAGFHYNPTSPPADSFRHLEQFHGWRRPPPGQPRSSEQQEAWTGYQEALVAEVREWFGDENDIRAWRQLCQAVGIKSPPWSVKACRSALRGTHVNIVDLIEWGRSGRPVDSPVTVFATMEDLRKYTFSTGNIFPQSEVERDGETNIVLRHLLRSFFKMAPRKRFSY